MDERTQELLREWRATDDPELGARYLTARLHAGELDWASVETAAFLGDPSALLLMGEDVLAMSLPETGLRKLFAGVVALAGCTRQVVLRLVLGAAHGVTIGRWDVEGREVVFALLGDALRALDGEEVNLEAVQQELAEETCFDDFYDDQALLVDVVGLVAAPHLPSPEALLEQVQESAGRRWRAKEARAGIRRAFLPWLLLREAAPSACDGPLARARAQRLGPADPEALWHGGPVSRSEAEAVLDAAPGPGERFHEGHALWIVQAFHLARGWKRPERGPYLVSPSGRRRLKVARVFFVLEERDEQGRYRPRPTHAGQGIKARPWSQQLLEAARRALE
ncbi:MAG: hypothetical protein AB7N76_12425 [Planctomycetota bacterium]